MVPIINYIQGTFKSEQAFKKALIKQWKKDYTCFEIENEKEPGMPDVLRVDMFNYVSFVETKISDEKGYIKFQKTQPLWYKQNAHLPIIIFAWDIRKNHLVQIFPNEIKSLRMKLP